MLRKPIAAGLLFVVLVWAEMSLAPMLLMHFSHVHAAAQMAEQMASPHHAMPAGHRCCPGIQKTEDAVFAEFAGTGSPCDDDHRCCFRPGPLNVPAPASAGHKLARAIAPAEQTIPNLADEASKDFPAVAMTPGSPPGVLGMILRV